MKRTFFWTVFVVILCASCQKVVLDEELINGVKKRITFNIKGGFRTIQTRANVEKVKETAMTDVWVFDYVDGKLAQQVHQDCKSASDFGSPTLSLAMGDHELYFVCSAGGSPILNVEAHQISWDIPRDTFWKKLTKKVTARTAENSNVTLERVTTRLTVNIEDALPATLAQVEITPSRWYYGLDYLTGDGTDEKNGVFTISVPKKYIGRTSIRFHAHSIAQVDEFVTNVTITAKDASGGIITTQTITDAPMQRNRSTDYTGTLFTDNHTTSLTLNTNWAEPWTGTW